MIHRFVSLALVVCGLALMLATPTSSPETPVVEKYEPVIVIPAESIRPVPKPKWTEEEVIVLSKMLWGEARGIPSDMEKAAVVWCVLNRVDSFGTSIVDTVTAPHQFAGYIESNPVDPSLSAICEDVLSRWFAEKDGMNGIGRVLPPDYLWFTGNGKHNFFRNQYQGGSTWDWSLPNPYKEGAYV